MSHRPPVWTTRLATPGANAFAILSGLETMTRSLIAAALPIQTQRLFGNDESVSALVLIGSVAALAIAVNLVELACSAGLPAIYTQMLAMHDLPRAGYYGFLLLYISVFLLDDTAIFVVAMVTLRAATGTGRYARISHLVGGVVLLALGTVMVLRPDLLG